MAKSKVLDSLLKSSEDFFFFSKPGNVDHQYRFINKLYKYQKH